MIIYVDGSCLGNGTESNFGGFGLVVIQNDAITHQVSQGCKNTTNNEMELLSILTALRYIKDNNVQDKTIIYSDSAYCVNLINEWMFNWASNNWKKKDNSTPKNLELIQAIYDTITHSFNVVVKKVKGHSINFYNNLADALATEASKKIRDEYLQESKEV